MDCSVCSETALKEKDPSLHFKVNIGLPYLKPPRGEEFAQRKTVLSERRRQASMPEVNLEKIREEWLKNSGPFQIKAIAEHYNIFEDLFGEAYFVPRVPLRIHYDQADGKAMPVYYGNQIKPAEVKYIFYYPSIY